MRHGGPFVAFDDMISGTATVYTSTVLNERLGGYNQLAVQAIVDTAATATEFALWIEHSNDGRNWFIRNDAAQTLNPTEATGANTEDIRITGIAGNTTYGGYVTDYAGGVSRNPNGGTATAGTNGPLLAFVRLAMKINGGSLHVKLMVTVRT
jgi:hypothetical protein